MISSTGSGPGFLFIFQMVAAKSHFASRAVPGFFEKLAVAAKDIVQREIFHFLAGFICFIPSSHHTVSVDNRNDLKSPCWEM